MERYSEYKDSGVKWLGKIPSHWELIKSKYLWKEQFATSENGFEQLLSVSQYDGITLAKGDSRSESLKGYKIVSKDDLVINIMLAWMGGLGVSNHDGIVSPAYCIYRLTGNSNPKYLHYLYKTPLYLAEFTRHSTGVIPSRWRMYTDDFGQVLSLIPPRKEQDAIVSYLDERMGKIDTAIAQQQKMIDLLNERKQIIINKAVTKGLDSNVKMKSSGIDWIGEIPEHWEIRKASLCVDISNGSDPKTEGDVPVYGSGSNSFRTCGEYKEGPCVLIGRKGATLHIPHYIEGRYWNVDTAFDVKTKSDDILLEFYYLLATQFDYKYYISQTTLPSMTSFDYNRMKLPIPSLREQMKIIEYVKLSTNSIDSAIKSAEKLISLLQERKQIIINDVVIGKIKVV